VFSSLSPIFALLRGTAFLQAASGLHGLLLPLRGQQEGFSETTLGLLGTGWAAGFVAGCLLAPKMVQRVGHVRAFGTFAAMAAIIALLSGLMIETISWIVLRIVTGFAMAGALMIIESWMNEKADNDTRGTVFGLYMIVSFAAVTGGQMAVAFGDTSNASLFMVTGILFCFALIPTAMSTASSPKPLASASLDLWTLYDTSPVASAACLLIGMANGAWGTLGPVYGSQIGLSNFDIALMMSLAMIAGAVLQLPLGRLSDRLDRRHVLAGAAFAAAALALAIAVFQPRGGTVVLAMTAAYGAFAYTLYSIAVAHANDHARPEDFVKVSGGLLLLFGIGTMIGPLIGSTAMELLTPESVFIATVLPHLAIGGYAILRTYRRAPVPLDKRESFTAVAGERAQTPEAVKLDPRGAAE
jgi:MFS family permease